MADVSFTPPPINTSGMQSSMRSLTNSTRAFSIEMEKSADLGKQFGSVIGAAFEGVVFKGKSVQDALRSLALTMSQMVLKSAMAPLTNLTTKMLGGLLSSATKMFTGGGGLASPGGLSGLGLSDGLGNGSSDAAGSWATQVNFNVTATDADSFRRSESQLAAMLARTVGTGQRNL